MAARPAPPAPRARPSRLGVPLDAFQLRRLAELEQIVGPSRYAGWGRVGEAADWTARTPSTWEEFFVDVIDSTGAIERHTGPTLHLAVGDALRAARSSR
jgi:hypothetical protein